MALIVASAAGINETHPTGYLVDRPGGLGEWLIMRFRSPFEAHTTDGQVVGEPGDCLVNSPRFVNWHRGHHGPFSNDWIHLDGRPVGPLIRQARLPINQVFRPPDTHFIPTMLHQIELERHRQDLHWQEQVDLQVRQMVLLLGRCLQRTQRLRFTPAEAEHLQRFRDLRAQVFQDLSKPWTIELMAEIACLSESRFQVLYKRFFQISPLQDLLRARISHAQMLLTNAAASVGESARACGFESPAYFSRVFRRHVGVSPRQYRRSRA